MQPPTGVVPPSTTAMSMNQQQQPLQPAAAWPQQPPQNYGFFRFGDESEQTRAMTEMDGMLCSTRPMRIGPAATKKSGIAQRVEVENGASEFEEELKEIPKIVTMVSHEAKLRELLCNITSIEIKLCSHASKEFIKLLGGDVGGELLHQYVQTSSNCSELMEAWKIRRGKSGISYIISLITAILSHSCGQYEPNDMGRIAISRALDKFARLIIVEKMEDVYMELSSKEPKRQSAALLLMTSIVRRGSGLASEVTKGFNFKLPVFSKLAVYKQKKIEPDRKYSTRKPFVGFAMSFLEVGKPGLLRWVLQQKEMYSGVLRGLGNDDDDTIIYVLSTLRDRVLTEESLVPPGLRSVLFGSVTLGELISISGRDNGGPAAALAHSILVMICTYPCNGLMPDLNRHPNPLRGNQKRLLGLMKKLRATEVGYHRDLLLAIVSGRPYFGSAYMDDFPYNFEDHTSPNWLSVVSLAANLISSVGSSLPVGFLHSDSHGPPSFDSPEVQYILKCACPRPLNRLVVNKGLLHSDFLVKHGTLRLLLETLKLLNCFVDAINRSSCSINSMMHRWESLKQEIQNDVRTSLPDPQVLLTLLSSLSGHNKSLELCLKRAADLGNFPEFNGSGMKKQKTGDINGDSDILVGGLSAVRDVSFLGDDEGVLDTLAAEELDNGEDYMKVIAEIWGLQKCPMSGTVLKDSEIYFYSKLLDVIKIYQRVMPTILEGSFDFFKIFPSNPLALPTILQQSLLSFLVEHIAWSPEHGIAARTVPLMYKHLRSFINLMMHSPVRDIKDRAYVLARAALFSTGAFDRNPLEIGSWFLFLPGYVSANFSVEDNELEVLQNFSSAVVSFLCDAVSSIGNNLYRYLDRLRYHVYNLKGTKDISPDFSPLVLCVLEKCLRLISSESGTFTLPERTMISLYVSNTLCYLLQTQVEAGFLSSLIDLVLLEKFEDCCSIVEASECLCEWRPLKNLQLFSKSIANRQTCYLFSTESKVVHDDSSFVDTLVEVKRILKSGHDGGLVGVTKAFSFSIMCTAPDEILQNFPSVVSASQRLSGIPFSVILSVYFLERSLLGGVFNLWPDLFFHGLNMVIAVIDGDSKNDQASRMPVLCSSPKEIVCGIDIDSKDSASIAFSLFLKQMPFYMLFPALMNFGALNSLKHSGVQELLLAKLHELTTDHFASSLRLVLFWIGQIQSSYRAEPSDKLEELSKTCYVVMEGMLAQLLVINPESARSTIVGTHLSTKNIQEAFEIIFSHPAVIISLTCPLCFNEEFTDLGENLENFLCLCWSRVHKMDHFALNLLTSAADCFLASCKSQKLTSEVDEPMRRCISKAFKFLMQRLLLLFRERFDVCVEAKNLVPLLPTLYLLHSLISYISPFELLELVDWMSFRADLNDLQFFESFKISALSIGLRIVGCAFKSLSSYMQKPTMKTVSSDLLWGLEEKSSYVALFDRIYFKIYELSTCCELDAADLCLLRAAHFGCMHKYSRHQNHLLPLSMDMLRVITSTPMKILSRCVHKTNRTRAEFLIVLVKVSPLHLSFFGLLFSDILSKGQLQNGNVREDTCHHSLSDEDSMMLLPAVLFYLNSTFIKFGEQSYKLLRSIAAYYSRIILDGFVNWKSYVSGYVFLMNFDELLPSSMEELSILLNNSLLGKAICMLHYHFALSADSITLKKRLKLFNSICLQSDIHNDLLECDVGEIDSYSLTESLNFVNRVVAKISICQILLFPDDDLIHSLPKEPGGNKKVKDSMKEVLSRMQFINVLVHAWQLIVQKIPSGSNNSEITMGKTCFLFKFLEVHILRKVVDFSRKMHDSFVELDSLPFMEQFAQSSLLYRFEDARTLKMLRSVITSLPEDKFSYPLVLQLLLAHSQFAPTIYSVSESSSFCQIGTVFRPMSSILRLLVIPLTNQISMCGMDYSQTSELNRKQLEVIKLLRTLYHFKALGIGCDSDMNSGIDYRELLFLLISSYGATLSEIDLEIYNLMHEIESADGSNSGHIANMDYLWGAAAIKLRKERMQDQGIINDSVDTEATEEQRRRLFRENIPIDPRMCAMTVLYFPFDRTADGADICSSKFQQDIFWNMPLMDSAKALRIQQYDPIFILRFANHCLLMGYLEPLEFAGLGLLAVAIVSISSPLDGIRKLGYEVLGRFKNALEKYQKRKDVMRLRLLLSYLQNGVEELWQRIPSITAVFAAEASFILLDSSHDNYLPISELLMCSPRVNLKCVPLFDKFFWSSSVHFKADRLWILRLLFTGLNLDDDAQICIRNSIIENLLSFYTSPLSDNESKELILLIVRKSIKLHKMARYLVEHCGLISWLSSVLSLLFEDLCEGQSRVLLRQLSIVLEVVIDISDSRNIIEWLKDYALEQLSEFSSHLHKLLVSGIKVMDGDDALVNSLLQILLSTLKISQKRKIYQPHFTLSFDALFQLYQVVDVYNKARSSSSAEFALKAILMSTPPVTILDMDPKKLSNFLRWSVSVALQSNSTQLIQSKEYCPHLTNLSEEEQNEDSLISKLLRWLIASVILGKVLWNSNSLDFNFSIERMNLGTLQSLLERIEKGHRKRSGVGFIGEEIMATVIFCLQQLLGVKCILLPSVVSALCLLLLSDSSHFAGLNLLGHESVVTSLLSRIRCPVEASPAWRWSFYQPWRDLSFEQTDLQKMDEIHACQTLLVIISHVLGKKSLDVEVPLYQDIENSGVFNWERSFLEI